MNPLSPRIAIVAALEREVSGFIQGWPRSKHAHQSSNFTFFERNQVVVVCGGIGAEAARRAAEAVVALYNPALLCSAGFAGALDSALCVADIFLPDAVVDARDGSRTQIPGGSGVLVTFMAVADVQQKKTLAQAYAAQAVDMEAAAVAAAARVHGIEFATIKAISDDQNFDLPAVDRFIDSKGNFSTVRFTLFAALRPWLWRRVAKLASNSGKASRSLARHLTAFIQAHNTVEAKATLSSSN